MTRALIAVTLLGAGLALWWAMRDDGPAAPVFPEPPARVERAPSAIAAPIVAVAAPDAAVVEVVTDGTLAVRVTDRGGAPIADAEVTARRDGVSEPRSARSDTGGAAGLTLAAETWRVTVRAKGFVAATEERPIPAGGREELTFALERGCLIRGRVVTGDGVPVVGARVSSAWKRKEVVAGESTLTATDGSFALEDLEAGARVMVRVTTDEHPTEEVVVTTPNEDVKIVLQPGRTVRARVREGNGQPGVGALVSLFPAGTEPTPGRFRGVAWSRGKVSAAAGEDGVAVFRGVGSGAFVLYARHEIPDGGAERGFGSAKGTANAPVVEVEVRLGDGQTVEGRVVDAEGHGIGGARVMVRRKSEAIEYDTAEDDGRFEVTLFEPGPWTVFGTAEGFDPATAEVVNGNVTLTLTRQAALTGRVVDASGAAIASFEVNDKEFQTKDGRFAVPQRRLRTPEITVTAPGFALVKRTHPDGQRDFGDVVLQRGRAVTVTVVDAATQRPIAGAAVLPPGAFSKMLQTEALASGKPTGANGEAALDGIGEQAQIQVSHPDYVTTEAVVPPGAATVRVALEAGGVVRVRITGERGVEVVELTRWLNGSRLLLVRGAEGRVHLAPGRYAVRIVAKRAAEAAHTFELAPGAEVEVVLGEPRGATMDVVTVPPISWGDVLLLPGDVPAPSSADDWEWTGAIAARARTVDGAAQFPAVPPGRITVFVAGPAGYFRWSGQHGTSPTRVELKLPATLTAVPGR